MNAKIYTKRRERVAEKLENNSVMILFAGKDICKSEDESYRFTINRNFYYLTGVNEQNDILVLMKTNEHITMMMFINPYDEYVEKWYGRKLFDYEIKEISGIGETRYLEEFDTFLDSNIHSKTKVYLDLNEELFSEPYGEERRLANKLIDKHVEVINCHSTIAAFRMEKQKEEVELIKNAIKITGRGIKAIMSNIKPGLVESQVESFFDQQIKYYGASDFAFKTIAASGKNACVLHYSTNNTKINDNELVLFDLGAEYQLYKSDITRTIPANGKFTPRQKQIYNIVLGGQQVVMDAIRPGLTTKDLNNVLVKYYIEKLKEIGLIENDNEVRKYYYHGVSHQLGLDTHDVTVVNQPLTAGCIITVEPGLYIAEEGIGIRIEDDVLVTETGCVNLSQDIIKTIEDIEAFMAKHNH